MGKFSIVLRNGNIPVYIANNVTLTPVGKMSWTDFGGPDECEIEAVGTIDAIANVVNFLRYGVEIRNEHATPIWWGYIDSVDVNVGQIVFSSSLDTMFNKVKARYSYRNAYGNFASGETSWYSNTQSQSDYGTKELSHSIGEGSSVGAVQAAQTILAQSGIPTISIKKATSRDTSVRAKIKCKGWINILDWKYCTIDRGFDEYDVPIDKSFLLGFSRTSSSVSFVASSRTIEDLTYDFTLLEAGDTLKVTGSSSNNGTFTVDSVSQNSITVVEALTDEAVGSSVTLAAPYTAISQIFQTTSSYEVDKISIYIKKVGTPSSSIALDIMTDSSGSPSGTILQTATLAAANVDETLSSQEFTFSGYSLTSATNYHLRVRSNASASSTNFYRVGYDPEKLACPWGYGKAFNGSSWVAPFNFELGYVILDKLDTIKQIKAIFEDHGQIFNSVNYPTSSGVKTNQWRDGKTSAKVEVKKLFDIGTSSGYPIYVEITPNLDVIIKIDNGAPSNDVAIDHEGRFRYAVGGYGQPGVVHVGYQVRLIEMPRVISEKIGSYNVAFTRCDFNFDTGTYDWVVRQAKNKYNLSAIGQG